MNRTTRLLGAGALLAAGALALSGCTTNPGAAAVVGGTAISADTLAHMVDRAFRDPNAAQNVGTPAQYQEQALTRLISGVVVEKAAAAHGVHVTAAQVTRQLHALEDQAGGRQALQQQAAAAGYAASDLRGVVRDVLLSNALGDKLVADQQVPEAALRSAYEQNIDQYDQVHSAHILVRDKATADKILAEVRKNPSSFAALAKRFSIDTGSKDNGGDLGFAGRSQFVQEFSNAIFAAKPGSFVEVHSQYGWHVVHVIARRTVTFEQAMPSLRRTALQDLRNQRLDQVLTAEAKRLGVHVNPRFGTWKGNQVAAPTDVLSKPLAQNG